MRTCIRVFLFLGLMLGSIATASTVAAQDGCDIEGTSGPDSLEGGSGSQVICGLGGADWLEGDSGNDTISGNGGADTIYGGSGKDDLSGNAGRDELYGDSGSDTLTGGNGADFFSGGPGYDVATDFECGVDEHDGTVEEGIDCAGGGEGLPEACYTGGEPGYDVTCSWATQEEGIDFIDTNCQDIVGGGISCTLGDTGFTCVVGPEFFIFCNESIG